MLLCCHRSAASSRSLAEVLESAFPRCQKSHAPAATRAMTRKVTPTPILAAAAEERPEFELEFEAERVLVLVLDIWELVEVFQVMLQVSRTRVLFSHPKATTSSSYTEKKKCEQDLPA